jgi:Predicted metal-dependent hydrolase
MKEPLPYLSGYPESIIVQVNQLIAHGHLGELLAKRYGDEKHAIQNDKQLYHYVSELKSQYLKSSGALSRVAFDSKINVIRHALGLHTAISRVQGNKLKSKCEIAIASLFKQTPEPFLRMIVVHELAHLKEKEHNKAFYNLCLHMEPNYHQLEFDLRLYLTHEQLKG